MNTNIIKISVVTIVTMFLFLQTFQVMAQKAKSQKPSVETAYITANMHCAGCEQTISNALLLEKGIVKVRADHKTKLVVVEYKPKKTTVTNILAVIRKLGYVAEETVVTDEKK